MALRQLPSQEVLRQLLRYEPETGRLFWVTNQSRKCRAGTLAFTSVGNHGYFQGGINGKRYLAHRIIWAMEYGESPVEVDHINGDRADNRLENLRNVDRSMNMRNQRRSKANKSGVVGVSWFARDGKWQAAIKVNGQEKFLGLYDDVPSAAAARKRAEQAMGFHENHGREALK